MDSILFICQANVGRSQMAEAFFNYYSRSSRAQSAGVEDHTQEYQRPSPEIIATMLERGIDVSQQRVKKLTTEQCKEAQQIYVLCQKSQCPDFLLNHPHAKFFPIKDPFEQDDNTIRVIRNQIEEFVQGL